MCCICFERKQPADLNVTASGQKEDVCKSCADQERRGMVRDVKPGDQLVNTQGQRAEVLELLPDDPDYFARLRDLDTEEEFAALAENLAGWRPVRPT